MSAWIVSKKHIDLLVAAAKNRHPDALGQMLWAENHKSVNYRYGEKRPTPPYTFTPPTEPIDQILLLKQIHCYDYQSCEHDGWERSEAYKLCKKLEAACLAALPPGVEDSPEYSQAPWGI